MPVGGLQHRRTLDGLRGVAVAAVVVYHAAPGWLPGGFLGVDLFFVLSGFLITSLLLSERRRSGRVDPVAFWARRARRLLPAALLTLAAITVVATVSGHGPLGWRADVLASLAYVNNWHQVATGQSYVELFGTPSPTRHFWSLAVEEQLYLVWPLLVAGGAVALAPVARRRPTAARALAVGGLVVAIGGSAWRLSSLFTPGDDPTRAYVGTDSRAFELLVGALLALLVGDPDRLRRRPGVERVAPVLALGLLAAMARWDDRSPVYYRGGALAWALVAAIVVWSVVPVGAGGLLAAVLRRRPLVALGTISYGVYLFHWPVGVWLDATTTGLDGAALFALRVAVTLVLATASYRLVERPVRTRRVLRRRIPALAAPVLVPALVAALVLVPAAVSGPAGDGVDAMALAPTSTPPTAIVLSSAAPAPGSSGRPGPPGADDPPVAGTVDPAGPAARGGGALGLPPVAMVVDAMSVRRSRPPVDDWVPPTPPPARPRAVAQHDADVSLVNACAGEHQPPLAEYRSNGTGRLVAVLGDSVTAQMREAIFADHRYDWYVMARCGTAAWQFDHLDHPSAVGLEPALDQLLALHPQALVIAIGLTDVTSRLDDPTTLRSSLRSVLDRTASVPCRSWVDLYPNPRIDPRVADGEARFAEFNHQLEEVTAGTDVRVLDWSGRAGRMAPNREGYHPWLNPADWVHLLPGQGFEQRLALLESGIC